MLHIDAIIFSLLSFHCFAAFLLIADAIFARFILMLMAPFLHIADYFCLRYAVACAY